MTNHTQFSETNILLTQSQLMLWMGQKLHPESAMYNMAHSFEICDAIDESIFKKSFQRLIDDCDIFRIVFSEEKGVPLQNVLKYLSYDLEIIDHTNKEIDETKKTLQERTEHLFNLNKPLFDSALYKIDETKYIWFLNIHHLVTDATSSTLLFENFSKIYSTLINKEEDLHAKIPQYRDYLSFEHVISEDNKLDSVRDYWKQTTNRVNGLPLLYGEKNINDASVSKRIRISLGKERVEKLNAIANQPEFRCWTKDLTFFNIFLTTLFSYLKRVSGEDTVAIGALSHSRTTQVFKKTPGMFVELFPVVTEFSEEDTFISLYQKVRNETNDYLRNAQPGMANAKASGSFNVILNYIKSSFSDFNNRAVKSEWIHPSHCDPSHHMRFTVYDMDNTGDIELFFDLNESVFNKDLREDAPSHFLRILDAFLQDENQRINKVSLVSTDDYVNELKEYNYNDDYPLFFDKILETLKNNKEEIAIQSDSKTYTFNDLDYLSDNLCNILKEKGVSSQDRVAVHLQRSPEYIISLIAILKLGAVFVPIATDQPKERIDYILENSDCIEVISNNLFIENLNDITINMINLDETPWQEKTLIDNRVKPNISSEDLVYILYTSGSTGKPKGVMITHGNLSNYLFWCNTYWGNSTNFAFCTSISFDITYTAIFLPLYNGSKIYIYKESSSGPDDSVPRMLEENVADSVILTPSHLLLFQGKCKGETSLKNIIVIGEDFKKDLALKIQKEYGNDVSIFNFYGPTEVTIGSTITKFNASQHQNVSVPIGKPIYNTRVLVLDTEMNPVPKGVVGTLYLGGYGVAKGYVKRPQLTNERFLKNPFLDSEVIYNTGDLVRLNTDNDYEFFGRKDDQVKLNGHRIELPEIEYTLQQYGTVDEAVAVVIENDGIKQLVAFYKGNEEISSIILRGFLEAKLPKYMIPLSFKFLEEFPLTPNAKVDRKRLKETSNFKIESHQDYIAPRNEIEELVTHIWSKTLNVEKIGVYDNFLTLGGHSLLAMRLTSTINEELEMEIPLFKVFECPTVELYAKYIEETIISLLEESSN